MTNNENTVATTVPTGIDLDWVSVKDRMPKLIPIGDPPHEFVACSARVLVCGWADKEVHWSVADLRRGGQGIEDRAVRWNTDADVFWHRDHLITHWAPLSKPGEASATNGAPVSAPIDAVIVHKSTAVGWTESPRPAAANTDDLLAALRAFGVTYDDEIPYNTGWFAAGSCMARTTAAEAAEVALEMIEERYDTLQRVYDTVKCQVDRAYNDGLADRTSAAAQAFPERDPSKGAYQQGLYRKFDVRRVDGSDHPEGKHCGCRYFVLDLTHDQHAPAAMRAYAAACEARHPQLAADIVAEFGHAPETAHADDLAWHKESLKRHTSKLQAVWEGIREAVQKYSGAPREGEPFERLDELLSRLSASAHALQDAAPAELCIGVSNNDEGVHINVMQPHADGSATVLHSAECPKGDSFARFAIGPVAAVAPSDATENADAGNADGQVLKGIGKINGDGWKDVTRKGEVVSVWNTELPRPYKAGQFPRIGNCGWSASTDQYDFQPATAEEAREAIEAIIDSRSPATSAADAIATDQQAGYLGTEKY